MPLYNTEIVYRAVIQADDAEAALAATKRERRDIEGDCAEPRYELVGPDRTPADFEDGWTETDYPLGSAYTGQMLLAKDGQPEKQPARAGGAHGMSPAPDGRRRGARNHRL